MKALLAALAAFSAPLQGQVRPSPGEGDPRLQTVLYKADEVVELTVVPGFQLMVAFGQGERIETIAIGDTSSWTVTANKRSDLIFIKTSTTGNNTNMTVVTDARAYVFALSRGPEFENMPTYAVRFVYPEAADDGPATLQAEAEAYRFRITGPRDIRPDKIVQQGDRTFIEWSPEATLPAVFVIEEDGSETLVNGEMQGNTFTILGAPRKLVFRLDGQRAFAERVRERKPPAKRCAERPPH